jgi:hypothetical protein
MELSRRLSKINDQCIQIIFKKEILKGTPGRTRAKIIIQYIEDMLIKA